MVKKFIFTIIFVLVTVSICLSQTRESELVQLKSIQEIRQEIVNKAIEGNPSRIEYIETIKEWIDRKPIQLKDNFKVLEIHTVSKKKIIERTKLDRIAIRTVNLKQNVKTYFFHISDSEGRWYMVVSPKIKTESKKRIRKGKIYEMEITMFEFVGLNDWHPWSIKMNGFIIPGPRQGWSDRVYVTPNLKGLYYVK